MATDDGDYDCWCCCDGADCFGDKGGSSNDIESGDTEDPELKVSVIMEDRMLK